MKESFSNIVLSMGQEIVFSIIGDIYKDRTLSYRLEKDLKKAIKNAVQKELPYEQDKKIINAISDDIFYECTRKNIVDLSLSDIIEKTLLEHNDYNKNSQALARAIASDLPMQIIQSKDLNALINSKLAFDMLTQNKEILEELGIIKNSIKNLKFNNQETREVLIEIMSLSKNLIDNERKMELNNKFIPEKYKEYFFNKLFLEENINDNKIAILRDTYIKPHFSIMDFKREVGEDIVKFIEDFVGIERRNSRYKPLFNFRDYKITTLFIKGHPGSGKSSLFYYLAYLKSHNAEFLTNYKMYFIKLIELYKENNNILSEKNPLEDIAKHLGNNNFDHTVLVLDGLDEICAAKDINIQEYCEHLIESTFRYNKFKIIITTRYNYINIKHYENKNVLNIGLQNWTIEDLNKWTKKYFAIHNSRTDLLEIAIKNIDYLAATESEQMMMILAVPLLFYMITAIGLELDTLESIGQLYDKVFDELYARNYNENANSALQRCGIIKAIPQKVSRQIAMEIAHKMYQENELLLKVNSKELKQAIQDALNYEITVEMDMLYKSQIEKLFPITFFYKEVYDVVEFAHKSIMEFFCAEKLFQLFQEQGSSISDFIVKNMVEDTISVEVMQFFMYFLEKRKKEIDISNYKEKIICEFKEMVQGKECRIETSKRAYGFEVSKLVFKIYWIFAKEILQCNINDINSIISNEHVNAYMRGVLLLKDSKNIPLINNNIYYWNFIGCTFDEFDFSHSNLSYANFEKAKIIDCSFENADLSNSCFVKNKVQGLLDFSFSDMRHSVIDGIDDHKGKVYLRYTKVDNTMIRNCNIQNWLISDLVYIGELEIYNVQMTSKQLVILSKGKIKCKDVTIFVGTEIITKDEINELRKEYKRNKANWDNILGEYVEKIISSWEEKYMSNLVGASYHIRYDKQEFKIYINKSIQNRM